MEADKAAFATDQHGHMGGRSVAARGVVDIDPGTDGIRRVGPLGGVTDRAESVLSDVVIQAIEELIDRRLREFTRDIASNSLRLGSAVRVLHG